MRVLRDVEDYKICQVSQQSVGMVQLCDARGRRANRGCSPSGSTDFCSTALLVNGPDQTYEYIACGATATTQILLPNPTSADITSTITSTTTAAPNPSPTSEIQSSNPQTPASDPTAGPSSPTASNMEGSPGSSQTNIGAIVGGVVGSIVVICTTIFGVFWIRRKNNTKKALEYPPDNTFPSAYGNGLTEMDAAESQKQLFGQWNGLPAPVEMDELDNATLKPVELPENNR